MIQEAVILAGGFGTRLKHVIGDVPKPMAPVAGKPFLTYLLDNLKDAGVKKVVLATGYRHEVIAGYFNNSYRGIEICYSVESQPLFTGGAILKAAEQIAGRHFLVFNGDTLFNADLEKLCSRHLSANAMLTIALRHVDDTGRYGAVKLNDTCIAAFLEKDASAGSGLINGGIYAVDKQQLMQQNLPQKFSFEKDFLQVYASRGLFQGIPCDDYFIDIGVPEDYHRAQKDFIRLTGLDRYLFLDRDGVLNRQIVGDYVRTTAQWEWLPGALEAMPVLAKRFERIFVVTNQQGVGKGLFSKQQLDEVHSKMLSDISAAGGRIDGLYVCTDLADSNSPMRKPAIGMALSAVSDYPEVELANSMMIGDSLTDLQFGYSAGMRCVYVTNGKPIPEEANNYTDLFCQSLVQLAKPESPLCTQ